MDTRGTIFIGSDFILDDPWLREAGAELANRGFEVIHGPEQRPPVRTQFAPSEWKRLFGTADVIVMTTRSIVSREILTQAAPLRAVVFPTIGTETIDLAAADELGIIVAHGPTPENFNSMAESTVMLLLTLAYDLRAKELILRDNLARPKIMKAHMLLGKTIGLIGLGRIARGIVERLRGWGVRILAVRRDLNAEPPPAGVEVVSLDELLRQSDFVSIHATLNDETRHMLGAPQLAIMKPTAFLVNTSRGGIVDEVALIEALTLGRIAGAALDAFDIEPLPHDSPLRALDNVILTPHMVSSTREVYEAIPPTLLENIERVMRGEMPLYCRNPWCENAWRLRLAALGTGSL